MEVTNDAGKIGRALSWIVSLLKRYEIHYQIVGGLAAKAYGATRPLVDIDIYAPFEKVEAALEEMRPYIKREPSPWLSESWDLVFMALEYEDIWIEIGDTSATPRFFNRRDKRWEEQVIHYEKSVVMELYGVEVALMSKDELLEYKAMLMREVDYADIGEMNHM